MWTPEQLADFAIKVGIPTALLLLVLYGFWHFANNKAWPLLETQIKAAQDLRSQELTRYMDMQDRFLTTLQARDTQRHEEHVNYIQSLGALTERINDVTATQVTITQSLNRIESMSFERAEKATLRLESVGDQLEDVAGDLIRGKKSS